MNSSRERGLGTRERERSEIRADAEVRNRVFWGYGRKHRSSDPGSPKLFQENTMSCGLLKVVLGKMIKFFQVKKKKCLDSAASCVAE